MSHGDWAACPAAVKFCGESENVYYYGNGGFEFEKRINAQLSSQRYWRGPRSQSKNVYITVMVDLTFNAELSPKRYWMGPRSQRVQRKKETIPIATLSPPE